MKKLILVLAILAIAAPAFAAVDVNLVKVATANDVNIVYRNGEGAQLPRAFALVITTDSNAVIWDVNASKVGESNSTKKGYGIFPAKIVIDSCGVVSNWGSPIADANDPLPSGADQILPSQKLVLEFGSLYPAADHNQAPDPCGTIARLRINCVGSTGEVNIVMTDEAAIRGGVVLENGTPVIVSKTLKYACSGGGPITCWDATACPGQSVGDATCSGKVDAADLLKLKQSWLKSKGQTGYNCCADFNHSTKVDAADLLKLKQNWLRSGLGGTAVQTCP